MEKINNYSYTNKDSNKFKKIPLWKKQLIFGGVIALFIMLIIIIIVLAVHGSSNSNLNKLGELDCIYTIEEISSKTQIISKEYNKASKFDIIIDSIKVEFIKEYQFKERGEHDIKFILYEDINMDYMFKDIKDLTSIILVSDKNAKIKSMISTFESCINLNYFLNNGFYLDEIKSIKNIFYNTNILTLNLKNFNPKNIEDMSYMFAYSSIEQININDLDTSHTKNMSHMFYSCKSLKNIDDFHINTNQLIDISYMFSSCDSLTDINLSILDTTNLVNISGLFHNCISLSKIKIDNLNTQNVEDMSHMFENDYSLKEINIENLNTNKVKNMSYMFKF